MTGRVMISRRLVVVLGLSQLVSWGVSYYMIGVFGERMALACLGLSQSGSLPLYGASWACLGLAMRITLYEAAFATLVRIGGRSARPAISQITLLGGLSSTVFWPIGHGRANQFGWRGALVGYALLGPGDGASSLVDSERRPPAPFAGGELALAPHSHKTGAIACSPGRSTRPA